MTQVAAPPPHKVSRVEVFKEESNFLREPVWQELQNDANFFSEAAIQILKFHGSYQQDDRDRRVRGQEKAYQFMLRTRNPGGYLSPQLYLALDDLADQYGNGTLRITDRQGIQLHGILKHNLKTVIATIIRNLGSTLGACGDLNRNVMAPPAPYRDRPAYRYAQTYADTLADLLRPQTEAYYDIWVDGEKVVSVEEHPEVVAARQRNDHGTLIPDSPEPIYGTHYLPRKFKMAVTVPGDNSVDLFTQDIGLVVLTDNQGSLEGFNVYVGGGLGRTHGKEDTFPRLADPLGYVPADQVYDAVKAIVATQRDHGNRADRRHSRMKYLIAEWGIERFRQTVEGYLGQAIAPCRPLPDFEYLDFLGWHDQGDGHWFVGINIANGRVKGGLRQALRQIVERFQVPMRLTPHQNALIYDIPTEHRPAVQALLEQAGVVGPSDLDPLERKSMACPALPTCGLAVTESERIMPSFLTRVRTLLNRLGLAEEELVIRMTGCPNGCARPYVAEVAFVGSAPEAYQVWLGGTAHQTRLAEVYLERMPAAELEATLEPLLVLFKQKRRPAEGFGDFCHRMGLPALHAFAQQYRPARTKPRVSLSPELHNQLKAVAAAHGRPVSALVAEAVQAYLERPSPEG